MEKEEIVLAALATADGGIHTPVQVQKLLFLIDKKISPRVGGPYFNFVPYAYGPFDIGIYRLLEELEEKEELEIIRHPMSRWSKYRLTIKGQEKGVGVLKEMDQKAADYIKELSLFVRKLSFAELVSAIYKEYPEMKENSVFAG